MRKTDKKLENTLIAALTEVCEAALEAFDGFQWLTHFVNYSHFPSSQKMEYSISGRREMGRPERQANKKQSFHHGFHSTGIPECTQ